MDKVVYEVSSPKRKRRKWQVVVTADGKRHIYLNQALPRDRDGQLLAHPIDSLCQKCGFGYSHLVESAETICDECKLEAMAEIAAWWQDQLGINLGWRKASEYSHSEVAAHNWYRGVRLSEINKRFGERRIRKS